MAASTSQMSRFETEALTQPRNLDALMRLPGKWVDRVRTKKPVQRLLLDMDSSVSPTHGDQEGSAYNGHFKCTCYHPLFLFNHHGDLEQVLLRNGNVGQRLTRRGQNDTLNLRLFGQGPCGKCRLETGSSIGATDMQETPQRTWPYWVGLFFSALMIFGAFPWSVYTYGLTVKSIGTLMFWIVVNIVCARRLFLTRRNDKS